MFNIESQLFLNALYSYGALDLLNYAMTKTYLSDISRLITPDVQIRFNKKSHKLYLDIDWSDIGEEIDQVISTTRCQFQFPVTSDLIENLSVNLQAKDQQVFVNRFCLLKNNIHLKVGQNHQYQNYLPVRFAACDYAR